jgi:hypothetical protein
MIVSAQMGWEMQKNKAWYGLRIGYRPSISGTGSAVVVF